MTNRIKAASMTVYANDTQLDRVQTFGSTARLDSEDIKEIGNIDIIEVVDNVPTVDITLDANQYGSVKTLKKLAGKNFDWGTIAVTVSGNTSVTVSSGVFFINERKYTHSGATVELSGSYPTSAAYHNVVCLSLSGANNSAVVVTSAAQIAIGSDPTVPDTPASQLRIADISLDTTPANAKVPLTSLHIFNNHCKITTSAAATTPDYVTLKDFEFAKVDFACPVKEAGDNTTTDKVTRTMYTENAFVNRYDAAFSVNGLATESWSLESDNKTWFLNTAAIVYTDRIAGGTSANNLTYTAILRDNGSYCLKAYKYNPTSGTYADIPTSGYSCTSAVFTQSGATSAVTGETLIVRYLVDPASITDVNNAISGQPFMQRNPANLNAHPVLAGGLRQGQVEIFLTPDATVDPGALSGQYGVLRLQSVSISSSLSREALYEIGHKRAFDRPLTFPIPVTVQVEAMASDLKEFARLTGKTFASAKEMSIDMFLKNLDLVVKIFREDDVARALAPWVHKQPIKTLTLTDLSMTDEGTELRVEGNGTQTFSMKGNTNLVIRGRV